MIDHKHRWFAAMTSAVALAACSAGGPAGGRGSGGATMSGSGGATMSGSGGATSGSGGMASASGGSGGTGSGGTTVTGTGGSGGAASGSGGRSSGGSGGFIAGSGGTSSGTGGSAGGGATSSSGGTPGSGGAAAGGAAAAGGGSGGVGSGGAAGTTAGGGGASSPCAARAGLLFCDDFENRAAGPVSSSTSWVPQIIGSGTLTVDATTAHSGGKSLRVHAGDDDYDTLLAFHDATVLPAPNGRFYARAFVRLGRAMAASHNSYLIADLFATPGSGNNVRIGEDYAMLMYTVSGDGHGALSNANYYTDHKPGVVFTTSTWVCLELLIDAGRPEVDFWVDGAEVPDLHHTDWPLDRYDTLRFGFEKYAGPGIDIWYDDIAIGTARIGCQ